MSSFPPAVLRARSIKPSSATLPRSRRDAVERLRLSHTARRLGRAAVEMVLFLGVGGAMAAGALLLR
jgi:hypothetical protein